MNKRIRKKKEKQQFIRVLNELVAEERRRQAAIQRAVDTYMEWYERKQEQRLTAIQKGGI